MSESHQVLVCVRGVSLLVASEKFGLEVNTEKEKERKHRFMKRGKATTLTWVVNALKLLHSSNTRKATYKSKLRWEENKSS